MVDIRGFLDQHSHGLEILILVSYGQYERCKAAHIDGIRIRVGIQQELHGFGIVARRSPE